MIVTFFIVGFLLCIGLLMVSVAQKEARRQRLIAVYGQTIAARILRKELWQGATFDMMRETFGRPADVHEKISKARSRHTWCYYPLPGRGRFRLRIHFEDGECTGWEQ